MASDTMGVRADDLARLRAIAEEGRARPLLGGPSLIVWGAAIAAAALFNWAVATRVLPLPAWMLSAGWFALMGGAALLAARLQAAGDADAALSNANRVSQSVWRMAGAFLATLSIGLTLHAALGDDPAGRGAAWAMLSVMAPVTFGVFGIALAATAVAGEAAWLMRYSWAALAFTVGTASLLGQSLQFLLMAAGAVAVGVLPGLRMLRAGADG